MTLDETGKIVYAVMSTYSTAFKSMTAQRTASMIQTWHALLGQYSYGEVEKGVYAYMSADASGFPPAPGQVIDRIRMLNPEEPEMEALEAWYLVEKATRNGQNGYMEEYSKLPPLVQKAVGRPETLREWAVMDADKLGTIQQSHFIRAYNMEKKREEEYAKMPERLRDLIETTVNQMPQIPEVKENPVVEEVRQNEIPAEVVEQIEALREEFRRKNS